MLILQFQGSIFSILWTLYLTTLTEMYPKFTYSSRVEISIWNTDVFCSDVYISPLIEFYRQNISSDIDFVKEKLKYPVMF